MFRNIRPPPNEPPPINTDHHPSIIGLLPEVDLPPAEDAPSPLALTNIALASIRHLMQSANICPLTCSCCTIHAQYLDLNYAIPQLPLVKYRLPPYPESVINNLIELPHPASHPDPTAKLNLLCNPGPFGLTPLPLGLPFQTTLSHAPQPQNVPQDAPPINPLEMPSLPRPLIDYSPHFILRCNTCNIIHLC
jgi:hypothetical protein